MQAVGVLVGFDRREVVHVVALEDFVADVELDRVAHAGEFVPPDGQVIAAVAVSDPRAGRSLESAVSNGHVRSLDVDEQIDGRDEETVLESLLDRLAVYKEKILAIKSKIKAALFNPIANIAVAFIITAVIMICIL